MREVEQLPDTPDDDQGLPEAVLSIAGELAAFDHFRSRVVLIANAYVLGGSSYEAPGQLVGDFIAARASSALGTVTPSYKPGVLLGDLAPSLPDYAITAIREALPAFGRKIKGFDMADAVLTGVETRTSSPIRIKRGPDFQSINTRGLYPAGEGAGYAGGILSAGVDGIKVAEAVALSMVRELATNGENPYKINPL